jgi:hypothetical protein
MLIRKKIMAKYCQDFDSDEFDELDDEEQVKPKRKGGNVRFDIYKKCVYCQICYNEGHFTKECKLLIKFCQICKGINNKIMKYLITKRDMEISHIIQGQIIKIGKAIEIINNIKIIGLTN